MTEGVLTTGGLNRALLARQLLLERVDLPIPAVLERVAGIQAQYAPAMYIALWSRLARFVRPDLDAALDDRSVVQGTLMRVTIHLVAAGDYWPLALAVREARRAWWLRLQRGAHSDDQLIAAADKLRTRLADGPVRFGELKALVGDELAAGVGLWIDLVRVPPSGTWAQRRADLYGAADAQSGRHPPSTTTVPSRISCAAIWPGSGRRRRRHRHLGGRPDPFDHRDAAHARAASDSAPRTVPEARTRRHRPPTPRHPCASYRCGRPACSFTPGAATCCPRSTGSRCSKTATRNR